jgi:hypothetical protein
MCLFLSIGGEEHCLYKLHRISNALNQEMLSFILTSKPLAFKSLLSKAVFWDFYYVMNRPTLTLPTVL